MTLLPSLQGRLSGNRKPVLTFTSRTAKVRRFSRRLPSVRGDVVNLPYRIEQPQLHQFTAKRGGIGEEEAMHAASSRSLYVRWQVVDVHGMSGIDAIGLKE